MTTQRVHRVGVLGVLLIMALLVGAFLGWVSFFQIKHIRHELEVLRALHPVPQPGAQPDPHQNPQ